MGQIVSRVNNNLAKFFGRMIGFETGEFELSRGNHKFVVTTEIDPEKVWTSTEESVADGCGNIPVNKIGCTLIKNQLIFEAEIETDSCKISWLAFK
jgi:hypothetical protein